MYNAKNIDVKSDSCATVSVNSMPSLVAGSEVISSCQAADEYAYTDLICKSCSLFQVSLSA